MSTAGSRPSHHYSTDSSSSIGSRRLSTIPYVHSPVSTRYSDRRQSLLREQPFRPLSRTEDESTEMITIALQKAQTAVLFDQRNHVTAALDGYSQCCAILAEVIAKETDSDDITRLRQIHDTYSVRMHVLSTMHLGSQPALRQLPPLPTQADLEDFEDENEGGESLTSPRPIVISQEPTLVQDPRYFEVRPVPRSPLDRSSSSRDSTSTARGLTSTRKPQHSRSTSFTRTSSQIDSLNSLEQIPSVSSSSTVVSTSSKLMTTTLPDMIDEEMDDAAFLERITRGFTSDDEIAEEESRRTSSPLSSFAQNQHKSQKSSETFILEPPPPLIRTETDDAISQSPRTSTPILRQPSPTKPTHDRSRNTSSPPPSSTLPNHQPQSAKKNLSITGAQPMLKSLSANNAIPNADEVIVAGNPDASPDIPAKIKKRPNLIRVVSESTMRTNYSRLSTFDMASPGSPPSATSLLTPGTTTSSSFLTDSSGKNLMIHDRDGAIPPEDPPEDPYLRPYWLMRSLVLSMKNQKGAYINSRLFVPQGVWMLKNVKLKAAEEKINCFQTMVAAIRQVLETDNRNGLVLLQEVANLESTMDAVQQSFLRKVDGKTNASNGTNGDGRTMSRKMSQNTLLGGWGKRLRSKSSASFTQPTTPPFGKESGPDTVYSNAVLNLFECALVLEQHFDNLNPEDIPINAQLQLEKSRRRIAGFFGNVIVRSVLQDLVTLMNKHVKRTNDGIVS